MAQAQVGDFVWHDVLARDADAAVAFYSDVVPGGSRVATLTDPEGAAFALLAGG